MRILLIEDDQLMCRSIQLMLAKADLGCETASDGESGVELAGLYEYDAILLDLTLPDMHGYEVLRRLRGAQVKTPVIILTGAESTDAKVAGFDLGADDYVTKPFQLTELLARIHALVRRSKGLPRAVVVTGAMSIDLSARIVEVAGRRVHLTGKEYEILELLTLRKGSTLTKEMFVEHIYQERDEPELKIIDVFVCKLRKKLVDAGAAKTGYIETVWGRGYSLRDPEAESVRVKEAA